MIKSNLDRVFFSSDDDLKGEELELVLDRTYGVAPRSEMPKNTEWQADCGSLSSIDTGFVDGPYTSDWE